MVRSFLENFLVSNELGIIAERHKKETNKMRMVMDLIRIKVNDFF